MRNMILLSGPSCAGKGPLLRALEKLYSDTYKRLKPTVLYNDRCPRVGEKEGKDYYFRNTDYIKTLSKDEHIIVEIRKDNWQALPLKALDTEAEGKIAFAEVHCKFVEEIIRRRDNIDNLRIKKVFLSPLSKREIQYLLGQPNFLPKDLVNFMTELMRKKLLRRTKRQKAEVSLYDLNDIEKRAGRAYEEMSHAWQYDYVIPNHDGEDSDNWEQFYFPIGDALKACEALKYIIDDNSDVIGAEKWDERILTQYSVKD